MTSKKSGTKPRPFSGASLVDRKMMDSWKASEAPELLTQEEAIEMLRLDQLGVRDPKEGLRYLRRTRQLGYVKVAGKVLIPRKAIATYLARQRVDVHSEKDGFLD